MLPSIDSEPVAPLSHIAAAVVLLAAVLLAMIVPLTVAFVVDTAVADTLPTNVLLFA